MTEPQDHSIDLAKVGVITSQSQRALNAAFVSAMGWTIQAVEVNQITGFARIQAARVDGDRKTLVTILRSTHGAVAVERRDICARASGFYSGDYWELIATLGGRRYDGIRSALRGLAHYIDDNRRQGLIGSSRPILRALIAEGLT